MQTFLPFFCNVRHNNSLLENDKIEQLKIKLAQITVLLNELALKQNR